MVLPLFDDNTDRKRFPIVNYTLIAINIFVFVVFQQMGQNIDFTFAFSTVPEEIITGTDLETDDIRVTDPVTGKEYIQPGLKHTPLTPYLTLLTSLFMHGGIVHLLGNMLFLWIFGDNVEDYLGHGRYLVFYLVTGLIGSLAHVAGTFLTGGDMRIPSLGASGAISGVLGGYLLLFPHRRVTVILFRFLTQVPAFVAIGIWFLFQIIESMGALGRSTGVAYGAHFGGFLGGLALVKVFAVGRKPTTPGGPRNPRPVNRRTPWRY